MKKHYTLLVTLMLAVPYFTNAQGWKWATKSSFPGFVVNLECSQLTVDKAGNSYVAGNAIPYHVGLLKGAKTQFGSYSFTDSTEAGQMFVAKLNPAGTFQWVKATQHTNAAALGMVTDRAGDLYVLGIYDSSSCNFAGATLLNTGGDMMYFLSRFDPAGNLVWTKNVAVTHALIFYNDIIGYGGLGIDSADNLYVSGEFRQASETIGSYTLSNTSGYDDIFLAKFNTSGTVLWAKSYSNTKDLVKGLAVTGKGEVYMAGVFQSPSVTFGATTIPIVSTYGNFLVKFDSSGNPRWAKYGNSVIQQVNNVATDKKGNAYITGGFRGTVGFGSYTVTNASTVNDDVFLVKYDSAGVVQWARSAGTLNDDNGFTITTDACNNVFVCGSVGQQFSGLSSTYSMHFGTDSVTGTGTVYDDPLFIARYDASGNYKSAFVIPSGGDDAAGMCADGQGNLIVAADWFQTSGVLGTIPMPKDSGEEYLFVAKYFYDSLHCLPSDVPQTLKQPMIFNVYPNPAREECTLHLTAATGGETAEIFDLTGRPLQTVGLKGESTVISLRGLKRGIYLCRVSCPDGVVTGKIVVE